MHIELVARTEGEVNEWSFGEVTPEVAIKGFGGATLFSSHPEETAKVLTEVMGLEKVATKVTIRVLLLAQRSAIQWI